MNKRLNISKKIIQGASFNIKRNLRYYNSRNKDLEKEIEKINNLREEIERCTDVKMLMGIEGNIRKIYYETWNKIIDQEINFEKRVKRPPDNLINTMISFINTLVYTTCLSEIYKTQLNPTISYLHVPGERRFSLCLDLSEIFKPILVDRLIFSLLNKNIITESDFEKESNFYYIKEKGRKKILQAYDERLKKTIKHKTLNRNVSYRHLIKLECYKLIKHLMEDKEYTPFEMWW